MTSRNIIYVDKEYSAGIHRFTTVGDGSTQLSPPDLIGLTPTNVLTLLTSNVGIGTTRPMVSLDIHSTDALQLPSGSNHQRPSGKDGLIRYNQEYQRFEGFFQNQWGAIGGSETYWSCNQNTLFYSSNNVGIGTNVALYRLDVDGTIRSTNLLTSNLEAISLSGSVITDSTSTISSNVAASATAVKSAYDLANLALPRTGGTVTGDVNILANLFTSNLTVIGEYTTLNTTTSNTEQMVIENAGTGPALKVTQTGPQPVAEFYDQESGLALMIGNNGNIGIGTSTPAHRLDVQGTVSANALTGSAITDSISTTNSSIAASATAVKTAYDLANQALPLTGGSLTGNLFGFEVATSNLEIYSVGALKLPSGTTSDRPSGLDGMIRYNNQLQQFEGYSQTTWGAIGGGSEGYWSCNQNTLFYTSNNVGIGTNVALYRLDVSGSLKADTIYTSNIRFLSGTNIYYQLPPIRYTTYVDTSSIDTFILSTSGVYGASASNVQVYINNDLLFYYSSNVKDYDVSYSYQSNLQKTLFTLTLERAAPYGSLVDIVVWPQFITGSSNVELSVNQSFSFNGTSISQFQSLSNDLYFLGNLGIGTSNTELGKLVVGGSILPSSNVAYDLGSSNYRWRDIYLSGNTIDLGGTKITRNETTGGIQVLSTTGSNVDFSVRNIGIGTTVSENPVFIVGSLSNVVVDSRGFVGLGTTLPLQGLDVRGVTTLSGRLGIGTYIPQSQLHIYPNGSSSLFQLDRSQTTSSEEIYPPIALSQNTDIVSGQVYGNGTYIVSASSYYAPHDAFYVFDKNIPSALSKWISSLDLYDSLGDYVGSTETIHSLGSVYGEWIQIQLPISVQPSSYSIGEYSGELIYNRSPYQWYLLGSTNGTTWILLDTINNYTTWSGDQYYTFNVSLSQSYLYYRWVFNKIQADPSNGCVSVNEIKLTSGTVSTTYLPCLIATASGNLGIGTTVPTQALDVRGNIYTSGNIVCSNISVIGDYVRLNTITSNTEQMVIENAGTGPALKVTQYGNNSVAEFYDKESGVALFVGNNGNVGIGTNNPLALLDVNGSIRLGTSGSSLSILGCLYPIILGGALSDETTALATTNTLKLYAPFNLNIRSLKLPKFTVNTAATSTITFDVTKNGTTIYSSKPTITNGNKYSTNGTLTTNPTSFSENDEIIASVNVAGTGGTGAKVYIYCT